MWRSHRTRPYKPLCNQEILFFYWRRCPESGPYIDDSVATAKKDQNEVTGATKSPCRLGVWPHNAALRIVSRCRLIFLPPERAVARFIPIEENF